MMTRKYKAMSAVLFMLLAIGAILFGSSWLDRRSGIPVLNYHGVEDNEHNPLMLGVADFDRQMAYLQREGYHSITPKQLLAHLQQGAALPEKPILITFDDGYRNNYENAYPILKKYGLTATVFLVTDTVGTNDWYLTWPQVEEMRKNGMVFGSHTLSHVPLNDLSADEIMFQLTKSKEGMEWRLDVPVDYFAYPTGAYNERVGQLVKAAGYKAAFTIDFGRVKVGDNPYALDRIPILQTRCPFYHFYTRLTFTTLMGKAKQAKEWLLGPSALTL